MLNIYQDVDSRVETNVSLEIVRDFRIGEGSSQVMRYKFLVCFWIEKGNLGERSRPEFGYRCE